MSLRYTSGLVEAVGREAKESTSDAFRFGWSGGDLGNGARYVDGVRQLVWLGKTGARDAAAYYSAAVLEWEKRKQGTEEPTLPTNVAAVLADLTARAQCGQLQPKVAQARDDGAETARARWDVRR